jgi:rhodanese-related sulfurtransferase
LDQEKETVCLCHHGVRSMQASQWLLQQGFTNVKNVTGGIAAMARIDPAVPEY